MTTTRLLEKISPLVSSQLPEHIRENDPVFVRFIEAYYEFLEQDQGPQEVIQNALLYNDVDTTISLFIENFLKQYGSNIPRDIAANKKLLIKKVKDLYNSKGSEKSYNLLFQLLFAQSPDYFYPYDQVLKASAGTWSQDVSIFVEVIYGDPAAVVNQQCSVESPTKKTVVKILKKKSVETIFNSQFIISNDVFEYIIDNTLNANIAVGDIIQTETFKGIVVQTPTTAQIVSGGAGFRVGDILDVNILDGTGARLKVIKVDRDTGIKNVQFLSHGINYPSDFFITFSAETRAAVTSAFDSIGSNVILSDTFGRFIDEGTINKVDYALDAFDGSYAGETLRTFVYDSSTAIIGTSNDAVIRISSGSKAFYPGYYKDTGGFISDDYYLQDKDYYQPYAYVLKIEQQLKAYKQAVLELLHPAGMKLHGEYSILNTIPTTANITTRVGFSINDFLDSFGATDVDAIAQSVIKNVSNNVVLSEVIGISFSLPIEEAVAALEEATSLLISTAIADNPSVDDSVSSDVTALALQSDYSFEYFSETYTEGAPTDSFTLIDEITIDVNP